MGTKDLVCKEYMRNNDEVIRDLIRLTLPDLKVGRLEELNPEEAAVVFSSAPGRKDKISTVMRERDLLEKAYVKSLTDGTTDFVILGFENQDYVDYALPVRVAMENMLNYSWQIQQLRKKAKGEDEKYPREFLSGLPAGAKLKPVITIVVYWSTRPWSGPRSLHDILHFPVGLDRSLVDNSELIILEPALVSDEKLLSCASSLRQVFQFIRDSGDKEKIRNLLKTDNTFSRMPYEAVHVIEQVTNIRMRLPKNYEEGGTVDMCQAIADMIAEGRQKEKQRADAAEKRADAAKKRADAAKKSADAAKKSADAAKKSADAEKQRADAAEKRANAAEKVADEAVLGLMRAACSLSEAGKTVQQIAETLRKTEWQVSEWISEGGNA